LKESKRKKAISCLDKQKKKKKKRKKLELKIGKVDITEEQEMKIEGG